MKDNRNQIIALTILKTLSEKHNITWVTENADRRLKQCMKI